MGLRFFNSGYSVLRLSLYARPALVSEQDWLTCLCHLDLNCFYEDVTVDVARGIPS